MNQLFTLIFSQELGFIMGYETLNVCQIESLSSNMTHLTKIQYIYKEKSSCCQNKFL